MTTSIGLQPLRSESIGRIPFVRHGLTRRVAGLGKADGNISYTEPRDTSDAWEMRQRWCQEMGIEARTLVTAHQVHGNTVGVVPASMAGTGSAPGTGLFGKFDSLITNEPNVAVMMTHADCLAVIVCDPQMRAVGVIHAGWRGTVADVSGQTIRAMVERFGSGPEEILAFIGPGVCRNCYEVGDEVIEGWTKAAVRAGKRAVERTSGTWHFDLAEANRLQLLAAGVRPDAIELSGICTRCQSNEWFSHRAQGPLTGRFASIITVIE